MNIHPYTSFENEKDNSLYVERYFSANEPDEYRQYGYRKLREELGIRLVDFLDRFKSPCVVEIIEDRRKHKSVDVYWKDGEFVTLRAHVTNVKYNDVTIPRNISPLWIAHWGEPKNIFRRIYEYFRYRV